MRVACDKCGRDDVDMVVMHKKVLCASCALQEPSQPLRCDFCMGRPVAWVYFCPPIDVEMFALTMDGVDKGPILKSVDDKWAACDPCHDDIENLYVHGLADRMLSNYTLEELPAFTRPTARIALRDYFGQLIIRMRDPEPWSEGR